MLQKIIKRYSPFPEDISRKTFLITGANGFIGTHLISLLVRNGANLIAVSRRGLPYGSMFMLYGLKKTDIHNHHICDIYDNKSMTDIISRHKPDILINLAYGDTGKRSWNDVFQNIPAEIDKYPAFLNSVSKVGRLVLIGTCEEYGLNTPPFKECQREDPVSAYSLTKTIQYYISSYFSKTNKNDFLYLRPFTTYGPLQKSSMFVSSAISSFIEGKNFNMSQGKQKREFNFITDIAYNIILASLKHDLPGSTINIGSGVSYRIRDVAVLIRDMIDKKLDIIYNDSIRRDIEIDDLVSDNKIMRNCLSGPVVKLKEGLRITVEYHRRVKGYEKL